MRVGVEKGTKEMGQQQHKQRGFFMQPGTSVSCLAVALQRAHPARAAAMMRYFVHLVATLEILFLIQNSSSSSSSKSAAAVDTKMVRTLAANLQGVLLPVEASAGGTSSSSSSSFPAAALRPAAA